MSIESLKMYEHNPRKNDSAVNAVVNSIKEFGFRNPVIIDKNNTIVAGHTRVKAAQKLKIQTIPCVIIDDLTEQQIKAYRLVDNKTSELSEWDMNLLDVELGDLFDFNMERFGFSLNDDNLDDSTYTDKVITPVYELNGESPDIDSLLDTEKADELINEITNSSIDEYIKDFLIKAAYRHYVFNYKKIAEFYVHASIEVQELMEKSGLVIIDYDKAIEYGFVKLHDFISQSLEDLLDEQ